MSMALSSKDVLIPYYELYINGEMVTSYWKRFITQVQFNDTDAEAGIARIDVFDKDFEWSNRFEYYKGIPVKLYMGYTNNYRLMLDGEIAYFEANFDENGVQTLTVGCIDKSISMTYEKKTRSWFQTTRGAVVQWIADQYGFEAVVQPTTEYMEQVSQENETDAQLIKKMADDEAYEFYFFPDRKLIFFGNSFEKLVLKDTLYYKQGDKTIISFEPSFSEKNKKQVVKKDGGKSSDKSDQSGKDVSSGDNSGTISTDVTVIDNDSEGEVGVIGRTGAME